MSSIPDYPLETTFDFKFTTRAFATGVPTTLAGTPAVEIYEDNSTTQITTAETLTVDFDSVTGLNNLRIAATAANGFESGKSYAAIISTGTVGGVSVVGEVLLNFSIERTSALRPTEAGNTLDVTVTGAAGIDWGNVENPTTPVDLSATGIQLCDTITTYTGNTPQTGDVFAQLPTNFSSLGIESDGDLTKVNTLDGHTAQTGDSFARLGAPAGPSVSADIANIPTVSEFNARTLAAADYFDPATDTVVNVTNVATNNDKTGYSISGSITTLDGLENISAAQVNSEVDTALADINLDHWVGTASGIPSVPAGTYFDQMLDDGTNTYDRTSDSLQAIRDRGDAAWATGGGGALTQIINFNPLIPNSVDLANTVAIRLGIMLINSVDDLPSIAEITPGTISIDRKSIGGTSWTAVVVDAACSEAAGLVYYDEVFDSGTGYAEGDSIRITFKSQSVTADTNTHEITGSGGVQFQTEIRQTVPTAVENRIEMDSNSTQLTAIVADTNELQTDWTNGGRLDVILDARAAQTTADDIETDTQDIQSRLPAALVSGRMSSDMVAVSGSTDSADNIEQSAKTITLGQATSTTLSNTQMSTNLTEVTNDHYNGLILAWTTGVLAGQKTTVTGYNGSTKTLTFTQTTEAPGDGDEFTLS